MAIRSLDLDIAIYRNRVQVTLRGTSVFVDQPAEYPFSSDAAVVANSRYLEDTIVRAIKKILSEGAFSLRAPIAHVVRCDGSLEGEDRVRIEAALRETGMAEVIFELD